MRLEASGLADLKSLRARQVNRSLRLLRASARVVRPQLELEIARDPADNRFLERAEAAKADYLVTGNKRHFPKEWCQTLVGNARESLEWVVPGLRRRRLPTHRKARDERGSQGFNRSSYSDGFSDISSGQRWAPWRTRKISTVLPAMQ